VADPTLLDRLDFGMVDAESETLLAQRFVRTSDFDRFLDDRYVVVVGAKGSGKSALFEMFAKNLPSVRALSGTRLDAVLVGTGMGFGDLSEMSGGDLQTLRQDGAFQYEPFWRLYICLRAAHELGRQGYTSTGPLRTFLRAVHKAPDYRILPIAKALWRASVGTPPESVKVSVAGTAVEIAAGKEVLDSTALLTDIESVLEASGRKLWLLFDKVDELHPSNPAERRTALEGLFPACMAVRRFFPHLVPRVFIRSDLYGRNIHFTNKSHLADKQFEIRWDMPALESLLLKRALVHVDVRAYVARRARLQSARTEELSRSEVRRGVDVVFASRMTESGRIRTLEWMRARATDSKGVTYPREMIAFANASRDIQREAGLLPGDHLISAEAVAAAYPGISKMRCEAFLSEFPHLQPHFHRFRGAPAGNFTRTALEDLLDGLDPSGADAIDQLWDVGVLRPTDGLDVSVARSFEVPLLYSSGLGLASA
jgi:hypothetical protein